MWNLFCIFCNFSCASYDHLFVLQINMFVYQTKQNFTAVNKNCFNKNLSLKISQYSPENTCVFSLMFYKVQPLGLQYRWFLVNNTKMFRTPMLKNICEPLASAFFKLILWNSWEKLIHSTDRISLANMKILLFERCLRL